MPMKVAFELSDKDLRYFRRVMSTARKSARESDESQIVQVASRLLQQTRQGELLEFVEQRMRQLEQMVAMAEDVEWGLAGGDRKRVIEALAYFAEPADLIPDSIPGLGYLDDAIMVELVVRELRHELRAYADFCDYRASRDRRRGADEDPATRREWLKARRHSLQARMRQRRRSTRSARSASGSRSPGTLW